MHLASLLIVCVGRMNFEQLSNVVYECLSWATRMLTFTSTEHHHVAGTDWAGDGETAATTTSPVYCCGVPSKGMR